MKPIQIAPSILSSDFLRLGEEVKDVMTAGADWIHIDVMDGHFVPNLSIGIPIIQALRKGFPSAPLDTHLMISHPHSFIDPFIDAGSDSLTFHLEASHNPIALIEHIKHRGKRVGIAIKPKTALSAVEPFLSLVDMILIMTVEPGFSGQKFIKEMDDKIYTLRKIWHWEGDIQVDGGIGVESGALCAESGANIFVAASSIFGQKNPGEALQKIRLSCENAGKK